jgi:hypothetical protein
MLTKIPVIAPALFEPHPSTADEWDLTTLMLADGTLQEKFEAHYDIFIVSLSCLFTIFLLPRRWSCDGELDFPCFIRRRPSANLIRLTFF